MEPGDLGVEPEADVRFDPRRVGPDQGCAGPTRDAVCLIDVTKGERLRTPTQRRSAPRRVGHFIVAGRRPESDGLLGSSTVDRSEQGTCTAPGCLDNRLRYAARLKVSSCQATRIRAGLR